jgi:hypothetical protein
MPQPLSLRLELLHILRRLSQMKLEPSAIPDSVQVRDQDGSFATRKHIHRLFPLLSGALEVAGREPQVLSLLSSLIQMINRDLGN